MWKRDRTGSITLANVPNCLHGRVKPSFPACEHELSVCHLLVGFRPYATQSGFTFFPQQFNLFEIKKSLGQKGSLRFGVRTPNVHLL
ncbi:unnamed protein product [Sphenostylis stenocarpa]|uniref:Uncharacterized protein n=1 Tax=Sphenostylis stenocarpa TaxID=92480 RepID=A0AA86SEU2_9FABA|nr:unnamed protein product [Sphenostylis stenocarpa]